MHVSTPEYFLAETLDPRRLKFLRLPEASQLLTLPDLGLFEIEGKIAITTPQSLHAGRMFPGRNIVAESYHVRQSCSDLLGDSVEG